MNFPFQRLFLMFFVICGCKHDADKGAGGTLKIVDGEDVEAADIIAQSTVFIMVDQVVICTGIYIAPGWVLSARHCIHDANGATTFIVGCGTEPARYDRNFTTTVTSPPTMYHGIADLALFSLDQELPITPMKIGNVSLDDSLIGNQFTIAGYGISNLADTTPAPNLKKATVRITGKTKRSEGTYDFKAVSGEACKGDSGGPLMVQSNPSQSPMLVAVLAASSGGACSFGGMATLMTSEIVEWISQTTGASVGYLFDATSNDVQEVQHGNRNCVVDMQGNWLSAALISDPSLLDMKGQILDRTPVIVLREGIQGKRLPTPDGRASSDLWVEIEAPNGEVGYVSSMYIKCM